MVATQKPEVKSEVKYARLLENLRRDLQSALEDVRDARDQHQRYAAQIRVSEFERAIAIAEEAEKIPAQRERDTWLADEPAQFGFQSRTGTVPMAPNLYDFASLFPPIHYQNHSVLVTDPLQIATLDAVARNGCCQRVPVGSQYAAGDFGDGEWFTPDQYRKMVKSGLVN